MPFTNSQPTGTHRLAGRFGTNWRDTVIKSGVSLAALLILIIAPPAGAAIPSPERAVLDAIYAQTDGAHWTHNYGWGGAIGTECNWYGISCVTSPSEAIRSIQLNQNNLIGTIPSLLDLGALEELNMESNRLSGSIPTLPKSTALHGVNLSQNALSGSIPAINGYFNLDNIFLGNNQLTGNIPSIAGMAKLRIIDLESNQLNGQIPQLNATPNLESFNAFGNHLTGPIPTLSGLTHLIGIGLEANQLTGSIPSLDGLSWLDTVDVSNNQLSGTIPSLTGLTNLRIFNAESNQLTGTIPSLNDLTKLIFFSVGTNQLSGVVPDPSPSAMLSNARSSLCPNSLQHRTSNVWDSATGISPWYMSCIQSTQTTLSSTAGTIVTGQAVTLTATVTNDLPAGSITFLEGTAPLCVSALTEASGTQTATCVISPSTSGSHALLATFSGNSGNSPSTSTALNLLVNPATTALAITATPNPVEVGKLATANVILSVVAPGAGKPAGTISVSYGSDHCTITLPATECTFVEASSGMKTLTANYPGDGNFAASSGTTTLAVSVANSVTGLSSSANPTMIGQSVTLTATVSGYAPTGTVIFNEGPTVLCVATLDGTGSTRSAGCSPGALSPGSHSLAATYSGDSNNTSSASASLSQIVNKIGTSISIALSPNPALTGQTVTATVALHPQAQITVAPTGTVTVSNGAVGCSISLPAASCTFTPKGVGQQTVNASYGGDANYTASVDATGLAVGTLATTMTLLSSANPTIAGASVTFVASVSGASPTGSVSFAEHGKNLCAEVVLDTAGNASCSTSTLTPGMHQIEASYSGDSSNAASAAPVVNQFVVTSTPVNLNQFGLTGSWFNPATSGQGILLDALPDATGTGTGILFGGWFTFDIIATGGQRWYTIQGGINAADSYADLPIYANYGGVFNTPPITKPVPVGQAKLQFSDCAHGVLSYEFSDGSGRNGNIPLLRLDANVTCAAHGESGAAALNYPLSGAWYNPTTSGQGLLLGVNPLQNVLYGAWYTFSQEGLNTSAGQRWYTLQIGSFAPGATSMKNIPIYTTVGGVFDDSAKATAIPVGTAEITFQTCSTMSFAYAFTSGENQGKTGTVSLVRVGPTPVGCSL